MKSINLVLVGGGHAHALFLERFRRQPIQGVQITVIDPNNRVPYTGMLPGYIAGHYSREDMEIDLQQLCKQKNVQFMQDRVTSAQSDANTVVLQSGQSVTYDYLSYDVGIHSNLSAIAGYDDHAVGVKPLSKYAEVWESFVKKVDNKTQSNIVVIGGGVAGVEVSLAMRHALSKSGNHNVAMTIIENTQVLGQVSSATKKYLLGVLHKKNITTLARTSVNAIESDQVLTNSGMTVTSDLTISAAGARPYDWLSNTGLEVKDGYVVVNEYLQSASHTNVFAVGDCAHFRPRPLEKAGVFAVRQAPVLYDNITAIAKQQPLHKFVPQKNYLKLISLGGKSASADKYGVCLRGGLLWRLKDYIDQKFMNQFK